MAQKYGLGTDGRRTCTLPGTDNGSIKGQSKESVMNEAVLRPKAYYIERTSAEMDRHFAMPDWNVRQKLALTCRILAREEHGSGIAGQISARGEKPGTMWTTRFGLGVDEMTASDFLLEVGRAACRERVCQDG